MTDKNMQINVNQQGMIKLAFYYEDYEFEKMLEKAQQIVLAHSHMNTYIKEYYINLLDRIRGELREILESVTFEEVYVRTAIARRTYDTIQKIVDNKELGFVRISDIDDEETKELITKMKSRQQELDDDLNDVVKFFISL